MPIDLGSTVTVSWSPPEAETHSVTLTVTKPDGTEESPTPTSNDGTYSATFEGDIPGRYLLTWRDTSVRYTDVVDVWPADPRFLISFEDAVAALQWRETDRNSPNGESLRLYIAAATPVIEDLVGAVLVSSRTEFHDGGKIGVALSRRPSELISVEVDGTEVSGCVVNERSMIVYRGKNNERFAPGRQVVKVTYKTGTSEVPPNIQLATRELVRHLWQIGQQVLSGEPVHYGERPMGTTPSGFAVPKRVIELCASNFRMPGIA